MTPRALILAALLALPLPVAAQDEEEGLSLMERGARMFMDGVLREMSPAIEEFGGLAEEFGPALRSFAEEMGPRLGEIFSRIDDWSAYEAPEILPNGDILIRRRADRPPLEDLIEQGEEIEL